MTSNASRDHSPSNNTASTNDERRQSAAFRGATRAFSQPPSTLKPLPNTYSGTNGALAAASSAGTGRRRQNEASAEGSATYGQKSGITPIRSFSRTSVSQMRDMPRQSSQSREQSPSHKAARLATLKTTPTRNQEPNARRPSPLQSVDRPDESNVSQVTDQTPTAATTSLVKLFESKQELKTSAPVTQSVRYVTKSTPGIISPTPIRPMRRSSSSATVPLRTFPASSGTMKDSAGSNVPKTSHVGAAPAATKSAAPARPTIAGRRPSAAMTRQAPEPPAPRRGGKRPPLYGSSDAAGTGSTRYLGGSISGVPQASITDLTEAFLDEAAASLQAGSNRRKDAPTLPTRRSDSLLTPSPYASATALPSRPPLSPTRSFDKSSQSPSPLGPSRTTTRSSDSYVPQLTVDSLANAMVASSLASSRAPSPSKPPPALPPPRRHGKSYSLFHHHHSQEQISRTPSPTKGMRHTMREPLKSDDDVDYRKKKGHIVRKHPNKHHEGDRKRYRNQVTERERKRYEGVWAANKGLLMESETQSKDDVLNIVVRDIWSRSRLPDDVLEEVWDLVDIRGIGRLGKEEFVIGLWLIDSRLKGNKLPSKVSESMWASVRRLTGIKVQHHRR